MLEFEQSLYVIMNPKAEFHIDNWQLVNLIPGDFARKQIKHRVSNKLKYVGSMVHTFT